MGGLDRFYKRAVSEALKEKYQVNWKIQNFSEIRGSKEILEGLIHRFEMGSSIKLPCKLKCYLTCNLVYERMWITPNVALDEKPNGNVSELFATLQVEVNEGSVFRSDTSPMYNMLTDSISHNPLLPQFRGDPYFENYVNADGSLYLRLIVNLYNFENISTRPGNTLLTSQLQFEVRWREKLQKDLSKLLKHPGTLPQTLRMTKLVSSDDKEFFVNPDILRVRCPVLYSMLTEESCSVLTFPDISGQHLESILRFVHTATLPSHWKFTAETTDDMVYVAKKFELNDLVEFLEQSKRFSVRL